MEWSVNKNTMINRPTPKPGDVFLHFKGKKYVVIKSDIILCTDAYFDPLIMYKELDSNGPTWVRLKSDFLDYVNFAKYPNTKQKYRFEFIGSIFKEEIIIYEIKIAR